MNYIIGKNAVIEALRAGVGIDKVFLAGADTDKALRHIAGTARAAGAVVVDADKRKLDSLCIDAAKDVDNAETEGYNQRVHQGVVAIAAVAEYSTIEEILSSAKQKNEQPLIVICDEISDPHNLGAIIRTAEAVGAHGIIVPKRRSAGLGATVAKASSGAVFHSKIARVPNITASIRELKNLGIWIFGAAADGDSALWETDLTVPTAIVIGSEGKGISRLVSENCDFKVNIPMVGKLSSLNASVSAAILLYEAYRQRR